MPEINRPSPAAPFIKKCAREFLGNHQTMTPKELKIYIKENYNYDFTIGEYVGAIRTLLEESGYKTIKRGIYTYEPVHEISLSDIPLRDNINLILDHTINKLRKLGVVDLLQEIDNDNYFEDVDSLKQVIQKIEELKIEEENDVDK